MPNEDEKDQGFKIDHFYDEPSPDMFGAGLGDVKLGFRKPFALSRRITSPVIGSDFVSVEGSSKKNKRRQSIQNRNVHPLPFLNLDKAATDELKFKDLDLESVDARSG